LGVADLHGKVKLLVDNSEIFPRQSNIRGINKFTDITGYEKNSFGKSTVWKSSNMHDNFKQAHKTASDVVDCKLNVHSSPVVKYVTDTRSTEYEPHVIL